MVGLWFQVTNCSKHRQSSQKENGIHQIVGIELTEARHGYLIEDLCNLRWTILLVKINQIILDFTFVASLLKIIVMNT